jgi:hypothetical protein
VVLFLAFEDPKEDQVEQLENLRGVGCDNPDSQSGRAKKIHYITGELP